MRIGAVTLLAWGLLLGTGCGGTSDAPMESTPAGAQAVGEAGRAAAASGETLAPRSSAAAGAPSSSRVEGVAGMPGGTVPCSGSSPDACASEDAGIKATPDACAGSACAGSSGAGGAPAATGGAGALAEAASCKPAAVSGRVPVVYVIGDSTASVYGKDLYPRMGWAQPLQDYFPIACAKVEDKALSGRSSRSFLDEGAWSPIKSALRRGDFVLIQFGHNDEKREDSARYTEPFGSFQRYLGGYVDDALAAGATPILLTPIERNNWSGGKLASTHGDYPEAVRQLAQMRQLTLVDMTQLTHAFLERIGQEAASKLFMNLAPGESPNYPSGNMDNTHLQERGARQLADLALAELARQRAPLASLLEKVLTPP